MIEMSEKKSPFTTPPHRLEALSAAQKDIPDADEQAPARRATWKCDLKLAPVLGSVRLTAFLDQTKLASAKLEGFEKDLHIPSNGYNASTYKKPLGTELGRLL